MRVGISRVRIGVSQLNRKGDLDPLNTGKGRLVTQIIISAIIIGKDFFSGGWRDIGDKAVIIAPDDVRTRTGQSRAGEFVLDILSRIRVYTIAITIEVHLDMDQFFRCGINPVANAIGIIVGIINITRILRATSL